MSYLKRHRPICAVIQEIRTIAEDYKDNQIVRLCDEAVDYARRMSARLVEYKLTQEDRKELQDELE